MVESLPKDPLITPELIADHGITPDEYERLKGILKREPTYTELGIFSVMWSEHCSYKNSRKQLKNFPTEGLQVLIKAGEENAGVIDVGDGWAVAFKVESHNHPSAVEPFQGAATGVGGILRDIFTMGARPVINMNSLRFGRPNSGQVQQLVDGVVGGIAHYGNCMGIPTIGGDVYYDETYETNCLVNAFSLGIMKIDEIQRGEATGVGNPVFYVGAATGKDGIHGATFASTELTEESEAKRSSVQVGDPFMEKLLLEACLELFQTDHIVGIQDMGAAGLTCSTCETASRGGSGVEIDVALVPQREANMTPYEILLSESQERMLVIVKKGREEAVHKIFEKWDLHVVEIGHVTDDGLMRVKYNGKVVAEIPAREIADDAPLYDPSASKPKYLKAVSAWQLSELPQPGSDMTNILMKLLSEPTIGSKKDIYRRYDHMVRTGTVVLPGSDAAVFWMREADKYLSLAADCNGRYCYLDPVMGSRIAVAESARNIVCSGGRPLALTDCLNFGNPTKPEIFWQFKACVQGLKEGCEAFNTPVTGGNVSFYNENPEGAIDPTPLVVMVGQIDKKEHITTQWFKKEGDAVCLLDGLQDDSLAGIGGSEYLRRIHDLKTGNPPCMDLKKEKALQDALLKAITSGLIRSAHDVSEGGLAVCAAECCFTAPMEVESEAVKLGAKLDFTSVGSRTPRPDALLFGEQQSRVIVSLAPENVTALEEIAKEFGVKCDLLGTVTGEELEITLNQGTLIKAKVDDLKKAWRDAYKNAAGLSE
ncbi:phosphoribosylformylglycinamidine synthase subunit PurL [bacterium]|nr:phosphoribosylformylglycinamidine synthase subunit PurL [bacterium]